VSVLKIACSLNIYSIRNYEINKKDNIYQLCREYRNIRLHSLI